MKKRPFIRKGDSYKVGHWRQYPPGTTNVFSFFESRGGQFPTTTFFGLQYILKEHFLGPVFDERDIRNSKERFAAHFGDDTLFNEAGWRHILRKHDGRLPLLIKAVPEGRVIPTHNALMTIENTDPEVPWLTNYAETLLSTVWYPTTVCTQDAAMRAVLLRYLEGTGDPSLIDFKLHDFGYRGSTCDEAAGIGDAAHLVNFKGTDTWAGIDLVSDYYGEWMAGYSIPATEHSTMTSWGRENEGDAVENAIDAHPTGLLSIVGDSYNIFLFCSEILGKRLKMKIEKRDGTIVVRPDSGYPPEIVLKVLTILGEVFGFTENTKGYRVLAPCIRIIQGDGIDYEMLGTVLEAMKTNGWSTDNIAFGSGGGLIQKVNRDTQKCAIKCSAIRRNGVWHDVMKDPITDPGKRSKAGRLALVRIDGAHGSSYTTMREEEAAARGLDNELVPVFRDGELLLDQSFEDIRARALRQK